MLSTFLILLFLLEEKVCYHYLLQGEIYITKKGNNFTSKGKQSNRRGRGNEFLFIQVELVVVVVI